MVQAALKLVIEPIFEHEFESRRFGFGPGLGCKDALREVDRHLKSGHCRVVGGAAPESGQPACERAMSLQFA